MQRRHADRPVTNDRLPQGYTLLVDEREGIKWLYEVLYEVESR